MYGSIEANVFPFWAIAAAFLLVLPAAALAGHRFGSFERRRARTSAAADIPGETSLGALLALLGLLLGFTFGATLGWREARMSAIVEEAAAIGTAFLRADVLPDGAGRPLMESLLAYGQTRIVPQGFRASQEEIEALLTRSLEAQAVLWPTTLAALEPDVPTPLQTFVAGAITEVLDAHTRRTAAMSKSISAGIWVLLTFSASAAVFIVGNRSALRGRALTWRTFVFSLVLTSVLVTIEDLDRPSDGFTVVSQDALLIAVADMEAALQESPRLFTGNVPGVGDDAADRPD